VDAVTRAVGPNRAPPNGNAAALRIRAPNESAAGRVVDSIDGRAASEAAGSVVAGHRREGHAITATAVIAA